jgi:hypothetical protein
MSGLREPHILPQLHMLLSMHRLTLGIMRVRNRCHGVTKQARQSMKTARLVTRPHMA